MTDGEARGNPAPPAPIAAGIVPADPVPAGSAPAGSAPAGTTELGIDIIRVDRIRATLERFGRRFSERVLTTAEQSYVRDRSETFAGRWAAKEAVSKVLGLGVRGIGWRDIEIERLPTGQPAVRLHGRAAARAEQLGMGRVALSISHESDYAVAIAYGIRSAGGRFLFPPDLEERLDDRERRIIARMERLRALAGAGGDDGDGRDDRDEAIGELPGDGATGERPGGGAAGERTGERTGDGAAGIVNAGPASPQPSVDGGRLDG